jgi:hypothetical protein
MRQTPATTAGLGLIRSGVPMRHAAVMAGVSLSTLLRACRRHGITLRRGRPRLAGIVPVFCRQPAGILPESSKTALIRVDSANPDVLPCE